MNPNLKKMASFGCVTLSSLAILFAPAIAQATISNGIKGGSAYMTYDQATWATMVATSYRADIHGTTIPGTENDPTSDTFGNRYFYPQFFSNSPEYADLRNNMLAGDSRIADGTADPVAVAQWRLLNPAERVPVANGFFMGVDGLEPGWDSFGGGKAFTQSVVNDAPGASISEFYSMNGSLRLASDFIAPGGTVWFSNLDIRKEGGKWYIGSTGYEPAKGTIFELINPKIGVDVSGFLSIDADYKWGDSVWGSFLGFDPAGEGGNKVLGHIAMNGPAVVPVPGAVWLFGSALVGLVSTKRRKAVA